MPKSPQAKIQLIIIKKLTTNGLKGKQRLQLSRKRSSLNNDVTTKISNKQRLISLQEIQNSWMIKA